MQEWQDGQFLERADSGAIAAVHDAALVHLMVSTYFQVLQAAGSFVHTNPLYVQHDS